MSCLGFFAAADVYSYTDSPPLLFPHRAEKERRNAELEARSRDVRLQRALEEVEKYKAMIQELKLQVGWVGSSRAGSA